jgi:hypothetical protein
MVAGGEDAASAELARLGAEFARLRRRADRLRRRFHRLQAASGQEGDDAWHAWSATIDATLSLVDRIGQMEAATLEALVIKFDALAWRLTYDDALLDRSARRRIRAFGRELAIVAKAGLQDNRGVAIAASHQ